MKFETISPFFLQGVLFCWLISYLILWNLEEAGAIRYRLPNARRMKPFPNWRRNINLKIGQWLPSDSPYSAASREDRASSAGKGTDKISKDGIIIWCQGFQRRSGRNPKRKNYFPFIKASVISGPLLRNICLAGTTFLLSRTDNSIKNYFYSTVRRSLRRMGKLIGSKNSTSLLRSIKPSTLTHIFSVLTE
jgi:hypothetical protein